METQAYRNSTVRLAFSMFLFGLWATEAGAALPPPLVLTFDFSQGSQGWTGDIADYYAPATAYQPFAGMLGMPPELGGGVAFFTRAISTSDDIFIFLKRQITRSQGLLPNYVYQVQLTVDLASKSPAGCSEWPDAPGDFVDFYVGAATEEPRAYTIDEGWSFFFNMPLGTLGGDTANGIFCDEAGAQGFPFVPIQRDVVFADTIDSAEKGMIWVFAGAYLNGGGRTDLYYQRITVTLTPVAFASVPPLTRYITIPPPTSGGVRSAVRVRLSSLHHPAPPYAGQPGPNFASFEGQYRWVGAVGDCNDSPTWTTDFRCAQLQCTPEYQDWDAVLAGRVLYIAGSEIVPSSVYLTQKIDEGMDINAEANYLTLDQVLTARWGDLVEPYQSSTGPLNQPNALDVAAAVDRLKDLPVAITKPRGQLQPAMVDPHEPYSAAEVGRAVDAVKGHPYPFAQMQACP